MAIHTQSDGNGNSIIVDTETIYLQLSKNKGVRKLVGVINFKERYIRMNRLSTKHLLQKADSYGFNWHVLSQARKFDTVMLCTDEGVYKIPVQDIINRGQFLFFKEQGFEKQIFLTRQIINEYSERKFNQQEDFKKVSVHIGCWPNY